MNRKEKKEDTCDVNALFYNIKGTSTVWLYTPEKLSVLAAITFKKVKPLFGYPTYYIMNMCILDDLSDQPLPSGRLAWIYFLQHLHYLTKKHFIVWSNSLTSEIENQ